MKMVSVEITATQELNITKKAIQNCIENNLHKMFFKIPVVKVSENSDRFLIEMELVDKHDSQTLGGITSIKRWLKDDLGISPSRLSGGKKKHNVWGKRTDEYDYYCEIKK